MSHHTPARRTYLYIETRFIGASLSKEHRVSTVLAYVPVLAATVTDACVRGKRLLAAELKRHPKRYRVFLLGKYLNIHTIPLDGVQGIRRS